MKFLPQHYESCHCKQKPRDQQRKIGIVQRNLLIIVSGIRNRTSGNNTH